MAWIELHQAVWTHRKTIMLAAILDIDEIYAAAHMIKLWTWALDNAQDGDLTGLPSRVIAFGAGWKGDADDFVNAAIQVGWIDRDEDRLYLHDWYDYAGRLIEKREANKQRARKSRERYAQRTRNDEARCMATIPNQTIPNSSCSSNSTDDENPFMLFEAEGFGTISSVVAEKLNTLIDEYGNRWVCEAMKSAVYQGIRRLAYVEGILKNWQANGISEPWLETKREGVDRSAKPQGNAKGIQSGRDTPTSEGESITNGRIGWLAKDRVQHKVSEVP